MESAKRIKVLHIVTRMNVGGVAVLIDNLLSNLDPKEFEIVLAAGNCEFPEAELPFNEEQRYEFVRIPNFHKTSSFRDDVIAFLQVARLIARLRPDIIHTHTSKAGVFGRLAGILVSPKSKRVHTFHGHLLVGYFSRIKLKVVVSIESFMALMSTALIAMGTQVKEDLVTVGIGKRKRFAVFYPGVKQPNFPDRLSARGSLNLDGLSIYCIFIGRLTQIKRPERILEIAEKTKITNPNLKYLVVGDGELRSTLESEATNRGLPVKFLGWRDDIPLCLAASDLLLLTSDNEAVALTLIEASQAGIPFVTTPAGSVRDIARDWVNGFVGTFNSEELAEKVRLLVDSESLREEFGANGREIANKDFSISRMVNDHANFYMDILRQS